MSKKVQSWLLSFLLVSVSTIEGNTTPNVFDKVDREQFQFLINHGFDIRMSGQAILMLAELEVEKRATILNMWTTKEDLVRMLKSLLNEEYQGVDLISLNNSVKKIIDEWGQLQSPISLHYVMREVATIALADYAKKVPNVLAYNTYFILQNVIAILSKNPSELSRDVLLTIRGKLKVLAAVTYDRNMGFVTKADGRAWDRSAWLDLDQQAQTALIKPSMQSSSRDQLTLVKSICISALKISILGSP